MRMRDIRDDLRARARLVGQQIQVENTRFETSVSQLKAEQDRRLENSDSSALLGAEAARVHGLAQ